MAEKKSIGDKPRQNLITLKVINAKRLLISDNESIAQHTVDPSTSVKDLYAIIIKILYTKFGLIRYQSIDIQDGVPFRFINMTNCDDILSSDCNLLVKEIKSEYFMEEGIAVIVDGGCQNDFNLYLFPTQTFIDLVIRYLENIKSNYLLPSHVRMECNNQTVNIHQTVQRAGVKKNYIVEITHDKKLHMSLNVMRIFVKRMQRKPMSLDLDCNATVLDAKYLIYRQQGVPHNRQALTMDDVLLENPQMLKDYKIVSQSTLTLHE